MPATLSEDEIDDLLYLARTGENEEFNALKEELCKRENVSLAGLLEDAKDEMSGNGVLHMAGANGHHGKPNLPSLSIKLAGLTSGPRAAENRLRRTFQAISTERGHARDHKCAEPSRKHSITLGRAEWTFGSSESAAGKWWGPHNHECKRT